MEPSGKLKLTWTNEHLRAEERLLHDIEAVRETRDHPTALRPQG